MKAKNLICIIIMSLTIWLPEARCDFNTVVMDIVREVRPYIKSIPKSIDVYSYSSRARVGIPDTGEIATDDPRVWNYLRNKSKVFWDIDKQDWDLSDTDGLYAANDPVASREKFGKEYWTLYRVTLPGGYTYLDLRESFSDKMTESFRPIRSQLSALGCDPDWAKSFQHLLMKNTGGRECKRIALEVFKHLNVDAIGYSWSSIAFRDCPKRDQLTFIILNLPTRPGSIQPFMAEIPRGSDPNISERLMIESLFHQVLGYADLNNSNFKIDRKFWPWPELDSQVGGLDTKSWMKDHLMFCSE